MRYKDAFFTALFLLLVPTVLLAGPLNIHIQNAAQDRAFSEMNHHIAGVMLILIGIFAILGESGFNIFKKTWPVLFLLGGVYLLMMSDPDVWPMGNEGWISIFRDNPEAAQHKIYALLLIALGILELQRARGRLPRYLALWGFPAFAVFGAVLLFFHKHMTGDINIGMGQEMQNMPGMDDMLLGHDMAATMEKIKSEHLCYSVVGSVVAFFKFASDGDYIRRKFIKFIWPALICFLGVLLVIYTE